MHTLESTEIVGMVESTSAAGCAEEDELSRLKAKQEALAQASQPAVKQVTAPAPAETSD